MTLFLFFGLLAVLDIAVNLFFKVSWLLQALVLGGITIYYLPWIIARWRRHGDRLAIFFLNTFAAWTILAWVAALIWAGNRNTEDQ